jgi:predicted oxidoreductase
MSQQNMKTQKLGKSPLKATRLAYGCMRLPGTWEPSEIGPAQRQRAKAALLAAFEAGYTLFDHADIYCDGACEELFGELVRTIPSLRRAMYLVTTKCGIRFPEHPPGTPHRYDFSRQHIIASCEQSLKRLRRETIDIYQLHRPDLLMNPAEVADAFTRLKRDGKARFFGVSNFSPSFVSCLQSALGFPLVLNQVEIHLGRLACFYDGTLDQCLERAITPLAWSPLGGGWLGSGGNVSRHHPRKRHLLAIQKVVDEMAAGYGVSRTVLALAWLLKHPSRIIPIVGSCNPQHIKDAVNADAVELSREDWYRLLVVARGEKLS